MRVVMFYHSLRSDWNHGNAHFLRGVMTELVARGHDVVVYEAEDAWSAASLAAEQGQDALTGFRAVYRDLEYRAYHPASLDLDAVLDGASLVIVHEWSEPELVARIGRHRALHDDYVLLFHDTHHRSVTQPEEMARYDLAHYDAVLAYGAAVRRVYVERGWASQVFVWHEAADTRVFHPIDTECADGDVVWIGNWGDDERTAELREFLVDPVAALGLSARVYGVRYPREACDLLTAAGIDYRGWLPNYEAPRIFARFRATLHVPRRPYVKALPGVPTIRMFEALACGIPLVSAPWDDAEHLFTPGEDYLVAQDGAEMRRHLTDILHDQALAQTLAANGTQAIRARHTCAHRVDELLDIQARLSSLPAKVRRNAAETSGETMAAMSVLI
jgi:spore maturation protein CgeB